MVKIEPVWNEKALMVDSNLIIADLHIGFERELEKKGVNLPSQTETMIGTVLKLLRKKPVKRLIINGDLKHNIPKGSWQEYKEIPKAIDSWLKEVDEIHLIHGNHDGGIERYLPSDVEIHDSSGTTFKSVGYLHGHAYPSDEVLSSETIVLGHCHPTVVFIDALDQREKKQCWIRIQYQVNNHEGSAIILPHYNPLLGGISINEEGYLGPFLRMIYKKSEKVYLLDGSFLGELKDVNQSLK
ncbi:MAG: metallophosphoesterase [Thermoplasmatota archaeon]